MTIQPRSDEERRPAETDATTPGSPTGSRRSIQLQVNTVVRRVPWTPSASAAGPQPSTAALR